MSIMQCPNCQKESHEGNICPHCNVDAILYTGTVRLSDKLFNKGLNRLNNGELTHGIDLLSRSVSVNKNNIQARNLLGLALFEIGYIGEALKHWVISQSLLKNDNPATQYIENARKNNRALEALNDAASKYNQALNYLSQKSDDLAIIQLKRAVELNPRFIDALNLLALCHLIQNDREKAVAAAERVLAIDSQNTVALNYLSVINPNRAKQTVRRSLKRNETTKSVPIPKYKGMAVQEKKPTAFRFDIILALILGAACTFAVIYVLFYPALHRQYANQMQGYQNRINEVEEARREDAARHAEEIAEFEQAFEEARREVDAWEARYDLQDRIIRFHQADNLFRDGQFLEAVNRLDNIDVDGFPRDLMERSEYIREDVYPRLFTSFQAEGLAAFRANDYYKALVDFEMALRFRTEDTNPSADFLFSLGSLFYQDEARHAEAREILTELQERFPRHAPQRTATMLAGLTDEE